MDGYYRQGQVRHLNRSPLWLLQTGASPTCMRVREARLRHAWIPFWRGHRYAKHARASLDLRTGTWSESKVGKVLQSLHLSPAVACRSRVACARLFLKRMAPQTCTASPGATAAKNMQQKCILPRTAQPSSTGTVHDPHTPVHCQHGARSARVPEMIKVAADVHKRGTCGAGLNTAHAAPCDAPSSPSPLFALHRSRHSRWSTPSFLNAETS